MRTFIYVALIAVMGAGCRSENNNERNNISIHNLSKTSPPKESWKVTRQVDNKGNLIRYDSAYTWSYSNTNEPDSLMKDFKKRFDAQYSSLLHQNLGDPIWSDSAFIKPY